MDDDLQRLYQVLVQLSMEQVHMVLCYALGLLSRHRL